MDRLKILMAAFLCIAVSCSKVTGPESGLKDDEITVSVSDAETGTGIKSVLKDGTKTAFASGDQILVYDNSGKKATYKYRTKTSDEYVFQNVTKDEGFNKSNIVSAFYPADKVTSSTKTEFTVTFGPEQAYAENSFPKGAAPMSWFGTAGSKITFINRFGVVRFGFKYASDPQTALKIGSLALSSAATKLYGTFKFSESSVTYPSDGGTTVTLTGCESAGELGTTEKYFYIAVPGIQSNDEKMTVLATPTTDIPFGGTFSAKKEGDSGNVIKENNILQMAPFILYPVSAGGFSVGDWDNVGNIKVGQITLSQTEIKISVEETKDIKINGVSDWTKISTTPISGGSCFEASKYTDGNNYYIRVRGKTVGTGQLFVNDQVTNSGSYLDITVE